MKERLSEEVITMRLAKELRDGDVVNVGIGMASAISSYLPEDAGVIFHSENGVIGFGRVLTVDDAAEMDYDLINAGGQFVARRAGMCLMDFAAAFDAIRVGRVDVTVLGAYQVSERGDLASWSRDPEGRWGGIGGAMDMPVGAKRVIVGMTHTTREGEPKLVRQCTLPLTAARCVSLVVTDVAVVQVSPEGLVLKEVAPGWTPEEVQALTEPRLLLAPDLKEMEL